MGRHLCWYWRLMSRLPSPPNAQETCYWEERDSAALKMLVQKVQFYAFRHPEERISSAWRDVSSLRSQMEQRKQVVFHHTLIFSTVNIVLCILRGLQLYNAVLLFQPSCTLSNDVLCSHLLHSCIIMFWLTYVNGQTHANRQDLEVTGDYVSTKRRNAYDHKIEKSLKSFWFKHHSVFAFPVYATVQELYSPKTPKWLSGYRVFKNSHLRILCLFITKITLLVLFRKYYCNLF